MSPDPYVRGQLVVLIVLAIVGAFLGTPLVSLCAVGVALLLSRGLEARYRHDVEVCGTPTPAHRARLDAVMGNDAWGGLAWRC
jgi:hypothetical protein